ncbi:hypothetical protein ACQY0O_007660 [Thecaphora frezii]
MVASSLPAHATKNPSDDVPTSPTSPEDAGLTLLPPLVIVEGFLSAAQSVVWGNEFRTYLGIGHQLLYDHLSPPSEKQDCASPAGARRQQCSRLGSERLVVFAPIGPVSSLHDRACELFYALRGGTVDYGADHARQHGHSQWGRRFETPLCPLWGRPTASSPKSALKLPAHFLGHSLGGPTILKLQQLLRQGFFDEALGYNRAAAAAEGGATAWRPEDLLLSVTCVSSPFRGTPLVYSLGSEPIAEPRVRFFSLGNMIAKAVHVAAYLDLPFLDAHADAWHFSRRRKRMLRSIVRGGKNSVSCQRDADEEKAVHKSKVNDDVEALLHGLPADGNREGEGEDGEDGEWQGLRGLFWQLWRSDWAEGRDCAPWDCTLGERERDSESDGWGLEAGSITQQRGGGKPRTWYRSYAGFMTTPAATGGDNEPPLERPERGWRLHPFALTSRWIGSYDYASIEPAPRWLESSKGGKVKASETLRNWYRNDGVVPLASQFHPGECSDSGCRHFSGIEATLVPGKEGRDASEACDEAQLMPQCQDQGWQGELIGGVATKDSATLPLHRKDIAVLPESLGITAKRVAAVTLTTALRALGLDGKTSAPPLAEEEVDPFLTRCTSAATALTPSPPSLANLDPTKPRLPETYQQRPRDGPEPNRWYTYELTSTDHATLCPFWTGSDVQKQFWTGIGVWLADVDALSGLGQAVVL